MGLHQAELGTNGVRPDAAQVDAGGMGLRGGGIRGFIQRGQQFSVLFNSLLQFIALKISAQRSLEDTLIQLRFLAVAQAGAGSGQVQAGPGPVFASVFQW